jgi:hypothetical protein
MYDLLTKAWAKELNMRTIEEALAWCMEHDVTVKFVKHALTLGVQIYAYTSDINTGKTLGFGETFLEAVQEAANSSEKSEEEDEDRDPGDIGNVGPGIRKRNNAF